MRRSPTRLCGHSKDHNHGGHERVGRRHKHQGNRRTQEGRLKAAGESSGSKKAADWKPQGGAPTWMRKARGYGVYPGAGGWSACRRGRHRCR